MRWLVALLMCVVPVAVLAQPVDIAIVVSLDRSESIDRGEAEAQIEGLVYTLRHPRFRSIVTTGRSGRIGLSVLTWSSFGRYRVVLPWVQIANGADADAAAKVLQHSMERRRQARHGTQTDVAFAIKLGVQRLEALPWTADKRVINVVADGISNIGRIASVDRDIALKQGITVNGLIMAQGSAIRVMSSYFRREVIGGFAAFVQVSETKQDFADAMLRKMLLEIALLNQPARPLAGL